MEPDVDRLPVDALALSMRSIWEVIRSQKDLNLPAHKVWWDVVQGYGGVFNCMAHWRIFAQCSDAGAR